MTSPAEPLDWSGFIAKLTDVRMLLDAERHHGARGYVRRVDLFREHAGAAFL